MPHFWNKNQSAIVFVRKILMVPVCQNIRMQFDVGRARMLHYTTVYKCSRRLLYWSRNAWATIERYITDNIYFLLQLIMIWNLTVTSQLLCEWVQDTTVSVLIWLCVINHYPMLLRSNTYSIYIYQLAALWSVLMIMLNWTSIELSMHCFVEVIVLTLNLSPLNLLKLIACRCYCMLLYQLLQPSRIFEWWTDVLM